MSAYSTTMPLGSPGSFPLPIKGESGSAFMASQKMHPAAIAAMPSRQNPLNAPVPGMAPGPADAGGKR